MVSIDRNSKRSLISATLLLAAALIGIAIALPWDYELSHRIRKIHLPGDLRRFVGLTEVFAHSLGCVMILGTLWWIDEKNRSKILYASSFVLLCGVLSNALKYIIPRTRPHVFDQVMAEGGKTSWDTWGEPLTKSWFTEELRSFPSGHTATAVAMAIALSYVYPKGKPLFFLMALFASFQRITSGAHYPSDVLASFGLSICLAVAWVFLLPKKNVSG